MKRYAQVGIGGRARFFYEALATRYQDTARLVAFCDTNRTRMDYANERLRALGHPPLATYAASEFERMIAETRPDVVIVTTIDRTHHRYIVRAMELGCDVITEKPLTTDAAKAALIRDAMRRTGRDLRVTFNYRYAPFNTKVRELIHDGAIGNVLSVHFEWLLDTSHGADYFRRWHRDKRNSGGLLVHKATHHFDLVNFWIASVPELVFAQGRLGFYGKENAENRGIDRFYYRAHGSAAAADDPFALDLEASETLRRLYLEAEAEDGYLRDQSVFGDGISIEDVMAVQVRYRSGALMSYSLNAYLPWEGFRVAFNGDRGRLEMEVVDQAYISAAGHQAEEGVLRGERIILYPLGAEPRLIPVEKQEGGHGGGDPVLLDDLFAARPAPDPFGRAAGYEDGLMSILTGIAGNQSMATGLPVRIGDLIRDYDLL
ncbi:MAG: Gfo/Idh/MocA family oxidoreductase [Bacillota bacterium]|nr:Gfo/Idh/MocA family oxidoreductase [Bacillota bacterium]